MQAHICTDRKTSGQVKTTRSTFASSGLEGKFSLHYQGLLLEICKSSEAFMLLWCTIHSSHLCRSS